MLPASPKVSIIFFLLSAKKYFLKCWAFFHTKKSNLRSKHICVFNTLLFFPMALFFCRFEKPFAKTIAVLFSSQFFFHSPRSCCEKILFTTPENIHSYFLFLLYILESKDVLPVTQWDEQEEKTFFPRRDRRHVEFFFQKNPPQNSREEKNDHPEKKSHDRVPQATLTWIKNCVIQVKPRTYLCFLKRDVKVTYRQRQWAERNY